MTNINKVDYYRIAREGSLSLGMPAMRELIKEAAGRKKILDFGCGDGTRLSVLAKEKREKCVGIDNEDFAICDGKNRYPGIKLLKADGENLPFSDREFDFVYSAFVLEHLFRPEKALKEAIRVLAAKGRLFLVAPNYGAPNRRSPCGLTNKYLKLAKGIVGDFFRAFSSPENLYWQKVKPRIDEPYEIDFDTRSEPYILTLIEFLKKQKLEIIRAETLWEIEETNKSLLFEILKILGQNSIFPFKFWGPQILILAEKP